ncbi:electron transfer flavoprotein subunit alpha/FixB family protein, partial [Phenylobacterium sp.]|uniref:electron transfer flavoprotein subunit alpha/FixB family protein n=1 Tax=Phenylobacterium sp. TaxID=1871053 RepID=UPI00286A0461
MAVLVVADHDNQSVRDSTHKTVTAAQALGEVDILVAGTNAAAVAAQAAKIAGVRQVLAADSVELGQGIAEAFEALIVPLMANYDAVLIPASSAGKNFSPRVAAKLDVAQISDVVEIVDASTFVRPIYAGNALETIQSSDAKKVITVRPTVFQAAAEGGSASVETIAAPPPSAKSHFVDQQIVKSARPELGAAKIVVSGGRAMGSADEFHRVIE